MNRLCVAVLLLGTCEFAHAERPAATGGVIHVYVDATRDGDIVRRDLANRLTRRYLVQPEATWSRVRDGKDVVTGDALPVGLAVAIATDRRVHGLRSPWWAVDDVSEHPRADGSNRRVIRVTFRMPVCTPALVFARWPLPDSLGPGPMVAVSGDRFRRLDARVHVDAVDVVTASVPRSLARDEIGIEFGDGMDPASRITVRHVVRHDPGLSRAAHRALRDLLTPARFRSLRSDAGAAGIAPPSPTSEPIPAALVSAGVCVLASETERGREFRRRVEALLDAVGIPVRPALDFRATRVLVTTTVSFGESVIDALEERERANADFPEWTILTTTLSVRNGRDVVGSIADPLTLWLRPLPNELPDVFLE